MTVPTDEGSGFLRSQAHMRREAQPNERDEVAKQLADRGQQRRTTSRHGTSIVRPADPALDGIRSEPKPRNGRPDMIFAGHR
jgi:hypothetical protein